MDIRKQIELGKLVCPKTKKRLIIKKNYLITIDGSNEYPFIEERLPILLVDPIKINKYIHFSPKMIKEYSQKHLISQNSILNKIKKKLLTDYRTKSCADAFRNIFINTPDDSLYISIGGGPERSCPNLINLNIGPFVNVDIVADAHLLPYSNNSVDAIYCEAVLEHLYDPNKAIKEMYRVLKPDGKIFVCTPFLQAYHAYPHHYQNFTLTGHKHIFEVNNFSILDAGTCVGPVYTIVNLIAVFIHEYIIFGNILSKVWNLFTIFLRPFDKFINYKDNAHILASTTYLVAIKNI